MSSEPYRIRHLLGRALLVAFGMASGGSVMARHALVDQLPSLGGRIEGSLQVQEPYDVTLNGGASITGVLSVPGTPEIRLNGKPSFGGVSDGSGSAGPNHHRVTLNGGAVLGGLKQRVDPVTMPSVAVPPAPAGVRRVQLNQPADTLGEFVSIRDLTLNGNRLDPIVVPPGAYGTFTANGGNTFVIGVAGATAPVAYAFQRLSLNGGSRLDVVGPVVVTLAGALDFNGAVMGTAGQAEWLRLEFAEGGLTLNGQSEAHALVFAPQGTVTINGGARLVGQVVAHQLKIGGGGVLKITEEPVPANRAPVAQPQALTVPHGGEVTVTLAAADPDGDAVTLAIQALPAHGTWTPVEGAQNVWLYRPYVGFAGSDTLTFTASDGRLISTPATVSFSVAAAPPAPLAVAITYPQTGDVIAVGKATLISTRVTGGSGTGVVVGFFRNGESAGVVMTAPYQLSWTPAEQGSVRWQVRVSEGTSAGAESGVVECRTAAPLPFAAEFETVDGYVAGSLDGQQGWEVEGNVVVDPVGGWFGAQARLAASGGIAPDPVATVSRRFPVDPAQPAVVFVDFFAVIGAATTAEDGVFLSGPGFKVAALLEAEGISFQVWNEHTPGTGTWHPARLDYLVDVASGGVTDWEVEVGLRLDYAAGQWDLMLDGQVAAAELPLGSPAPDHLARLTFRGSRTGETSLDVFSVGFDNLGFTDLDLDNMDDGWESGRGLDPTLIDRSGDLDGDGLSNIQEFVWSTDPRRPDSDDDGVPDGWEVRYGLSPNWPYDAQRDPDGDGVANLREFQWGGDPGLAYDVSDGDALPDDWERDYFGSL